jgi:hypothetical protein
MMELEMSDEAQEIQPWRGYRPATRPFRRPDPFLGPPRYHKAYQNTFERHQGSQDNRRDQEIGGDVAALMLNDAPQK